ncbi:MAG TPA: uracil-DNA glycosylase, partial [Candidatus Manganitrophaceae bacterium]
MDRPRDSNQEIRDIAREMWSRMTWYREMGLDAWRIAPVSSPSASENKKEAAGSPLPSFSTSDSPGDLEEVRREIGDCRRCKLCEGRTHIVFGTGDPRAALMFVGEAPGEDEDRQGLPFVGRAGQLLTKMIVAMGLSREAVYIANIIKCR